MRQEPSPLRIAFAGMIGLAVAMGLGRFVFAPILPGMMAGLDMSAFAAGLLASANYLGYLVGAILAAGAWAQGRERDVVLAALFSTALLLGAMGIGSSLTLFIVVRFLAGVASAFALVFFSAIVLARAVASGQQGLGALHFGGIGLGIAVSSVMIGLLVVFGGDWRAGWYWSGLLALAGAIVVALLLGRTAVAPSGRAAEPPLPRSRALTAMIVAYGLFGFGYIVTATFLVAIVRHGDGGRLFEAAVWFVTGLAGIPSVWLWNRIARPVGVVAAYALGCTAEAAGVLASVLVPGPAGPLLGGVLLGGTFIAVTSLGLSLGRQLAGRAPRRALALMTAAFGLGQVVGPVVAGHLADWTGDFTVASVVAAVVLLAAALVALVARGRTAEPA
jgi:predicted MFS family arabinose efflux permease